MADRSLNRISFVALTALLASSSSVSADDEMLSRFLVAPGKFVLYNCQQLAIAMKTNLTRMRELESLMTRSGSELANAVAYRPEYLQLTGEVTDLRREAADKKCKPLPGDNRNRVNGAIIR